MDGFNIPIGEWGKSVVDWVRDDLDWLTDAIAAFVGFLAEGLAAMLMAPAAPVMIVLFALIAWLVRSWKLAIGTVVMFVVILGVDQWDNAMQTLALVLIATLVTVAIAVPLGIWAARNDTVSAVIKPVLDLMQTMPSLVYLIPVIIFFSLGFVPGVIATVIFSLPPGVRLTELGIRGVDSETVEAGHAFGATPGQILRGIQLPLAMPTIMAGVNQVIMLALSMAVIAGMAGAPGLGKEVVAALATINVAQGIEAGLGVVFIAVYLDRVTAALGNPGGNRSSLMGMMQRRRDEMRRASAASAAQTVDSAAAA
ncbi:proline/glycine betaine ABC transporter permease [Microbacterium esteraromaticum]|uniref:Proline/glycine betaine ABC transporter permease n=1 Tax=Microbacterium esteraromaticum TaxID=57043 RepID=A0A939DTU7_9MICO|nr:proline/glycine betaine ABC transporter permease [Microbacterium esteraromaticum]MBN8204795.1 proline/glycine betaine ABC transporter permease [Microbacterium esteraromaticum]MBN8414949.1 proline/glycine betaine ABC transporter permease [Microbacterium esteraromaticum]MBN8424777.1 proline/glycine betaine ABC transporter permease [Microbacterium esteraromaticum]